MATPPKGIMAWPGINQIERGTFALTQGISPSVGVLEILPQDATTIPIDGTLTITFGTIAPITFTDCRIDQASFEYGPDGQVWRLSIWDRRWKWQFAGDDGPISGWYNQRFPAIQPAPQVFQPGTVQLGSIDVETQQTPQQLAALLLDALGEEGYDVSQLPNNTLPEVNWDHDNPAQALHDLADRLGCRIVLGLDDIVRVVQTGLGADLPTNGVERESDVLDPPEIPDSIQVVGGKSRFQVDFILEPVGLDVDGTIKPIDELSYAPDDGWGGILDLDRDVGFQEIPGWETEDIIPPLTPPIIARTFQIGQFAQQVNPRFLARQTVFRWYRIQDDASADDPKQPPAIPGWDGGTGADKDRIEALWQILPIEDVLVLGWFDNTNQFNPLPAQAYGLYWAPGYDFIAGVGPVFQDDLGNFSQLTPSVYDFTIDRERGIVQFDEPMVVLEEENGVYTFGEPTLYLRCAVSVRDFDTSSWDRYENERDLADVIGLNTGTHATGPRVLKREEIVRNVVPQYDANFNVTATFDNGQQNDAEANYAIDAALLEYQVKTPQDVTYMGIVPIACDGAITQVVWTVGPEGATTRAARNTEINYAVPSFRERALLAQLPLQTETVKRLQDQSRRG